MRRVDGAWIEAIFEAIFILWTGVSIIYSFFTLYHDSTFVFGNWIMNFKEIGVFSLKFHNMNFSVLNIELESDLS